MRLVEDRKYADVSFKNTAVDRRKIKNKTRRVTKLTYLKLLIVDTPITIPINFCHHLL